MPDTPIQWLCAGLLGATAALFGVALPTITITLFLAALSFVVSLKLLDLFQTRGPRIARRGDRRAPWLWQAPLAGAIAGLGARWLFGGAA